MLNRSFLSLSAKKIVFVTSFFIPTIHAYSNDLQKQSTTAEDMILLTVDKTSLSASLTTLPESGQNPLQIRTFPVAIGKAEGDKTTKGDNKTPEGIYFTQTHIDERTLLKSKYGPHAIPLDFPNPFDKFEGKTGHGIWLHGAGDDARIAQRSVTEGCVAFYNKDIAALREWLPAYQSVVVIAKNQKDVNNASDVDVIRKNTLTWIQSWQKRSLDTYSNFYDKNFEFEGKDTESYKSYKKRVFNKYKDMNVSINGLRVVTHPKYAISIMNQDFNGDNSFITKGRKILFWRKNKNGDWKIIRENFENRRLEPISFTPKDVQKIATSEEHSPPAEKHSKNGKKS